MDIFLGVYWPPRQDALSDCIRRAKDHFCLLHETFGDYAQWYEKGRKRTRKADVINFMSESELQHLFKKGVNYKDIPREPIPELGWHVSLWNGNLEQPAETSFHVGCYVDKRIGLGNNALLKLENVQLQPSQLGVLLNDLHSIWQAERGRLEIDGVVHARFNKPQGIVAAMAAFRSRLFISR